MVGELQPGDPRSAGPYRLLGRLGSGGMGQVFLGRSAGGRLVAIKVIRPDLAGEPGFRVRFAREVAAARHVSGLFTALVVDADAEGPMPWLATAYVAGPSLDEAVATQGPLPADSVVALAAGLAEGLQAIHAAGVVHRDLKPSNVLLADDGPRVIDFGISRAAEATVLTQTGAVMGSPGFMSPEQAEGREAGPPSDVFSLGAVLAFAATGEGPFGTGSFPALMFRVVHHEPNIAHVPAQIRPVVERCLAKDPAQRPTPGDLLAELGEWQLATDWLPPPVTEVVDRYRPSGLLAAAGFATHDSPPPPDAVGGPPPTAGTPATPPTAAASIPQRPSRPAAQTDPVTAAASGETGSGADGPPAQHKTRRRLVWIAAAAAAVVVAASASAATALSTHGSRHSGTTAPSPSSKVSASASVHPSKSSSRSPTASPSAAQSNFSGNQPTTGQSSPTPTTTPTTTTTPTPTTTPTTTPTSTPTTSTTTASPPASPTS
jgi:eukaryotic-like serine/threonine-protein kinase